ncbi:MAG TPA: DUF2752 domain-containing protein [Acidimicrobiia bacterium]|nr:DUF2752 domain-containing protein [Acidimicrobiia bacterium]
MLNPAVSPSLTDQVRPNVAIADQELTHPKLLFTLIKGTPVLTAAAIATGCAYVGLNDPETKQIFPVCGFYAATGLYCPGCGMTRALHSVLNGNVLRAIQFNVVLVVALPILMYLYVWWMMWAFTGRELPRLKMSKRITLVLIGLAVFFIVGRNFPGPVAEFFARGRV